jgi:amino acid adenylation domain-containing protein
LMTEPSIRPASFAQKRLWFLDQLDPGSSAYNLPRAIRIVGGFDLDALQKALEAIVGRHESLRTTFGSFDGDPVQLVHPTAARLEIPLVSLESVAEGKRDEEALAIASEEGQRPFDLAACPLLRAKVVRLSRHEHVLILTLHHIVTDGWSMSILFGEISEFYDAFSSERVPNVSELSIQYADFACWEQERISADLLGREVEFWKRALNGAPPLLDLPADRPRPRIQGYKGRRHSVLLDAKLAERLGMLSAAARVTPFMTLLAAFEVLLWRYTGIDAFVVGAPVAGRSEIELEQLIGFFINTLPLRADLAGNPSFHDLLQRVRSSTLEAFAHQNVPFEKLVEELRPERSLNYTPLFQVMFVYQNMPRLPLKFSGTQSEEIEFDHGLAKFDLTLEVSEQQHGSCCSWEYSSDLFNHERIERMAGHFETLLRGIVNDPDCKLSELPLLTPAESQQILIQWNATETTYPRETCIHDAFQDRAAQCGDTLAVFSEDRNITFAQLNDEANALANYLRKRGVQLHARIGVFVERSVDAIVALLAVMKAGASYVPIDPTYPRQRIAFMLEDSGATVLVTQGRLRTRLPEFPCSIVCLDRDRPEILFESRRNTREPVRSIDPAYVIYTSGSTGTPKGVVATHRACMNRFAWMWRTYPFAAAEICAQRTSLSFVDSIWEIFGPLLQGVPLSIIPDESVKALEQFVWHLAAHRISRVVVIPSLLDSLLQFCPNLQARLPDLRVCVSSGEALPFGLCRRFRSALPQVTLINLYGSSEVAADVTCFDTNDAEPLGVVPIGRPIANVRTYVLDKNENPLPVGVPGEICIAGDCLALGYLNRPECNAERFVTIRLGNGVRERLYRTGDLGRYRQDGNIEFLGRTDRQVKIRGMRVEPGEIESVLASHPSVHQAVVVARDTGKSNFGLVAYVTPGDGQAIIASELRRYSKARLPEYMIPSGFVILTAMPLLPNGKVDQHALPPPEPAQSDLQRNYVAPRNETEEKLAKIWSEVLGIAHIGIHDNFFQLGGHSLMAVRMIARIRKSLCVDVAMRSLFEEPTLGGLAVAVEKARANGAAPRLPILRRHSNTRDDCGQLLARLRELSDEEVKGLLKGAFSDRLQAARAE